MLLKNSQGSMFLVYVCVCGVVVRDCLFKSFFHVHCLFVCLSCGLVFAPPTFTLLEFKKDDFMFLEVPDGVHTFELHLIQSILSF